MTSKGEKGFMESIKQGPSGTISSTNFCIKKKKHPQGHNRLGAKHPKAIGMTVWFSWSYLRISAACRMNTLLSGACACWPIHYTKQRRKKPSTFPKSMSEILLWVRCHTSCHGTHAQDRGDGWQLRLKGTSCFAKACDMRRKAFHP